MRFWAIFASVFACLFLQTLSPMARPALAQDQSWLQVEAQPDLAAAQDRARAYAAVFPNVEGYRTGAWYSVVLGPMSRQEAGEQLLSLRAENLIPRDSYIADGSAFGPRFWPVGVDDAVIVPQAPADPAATDADLAAPPQETLAEARDAENALSPDDKRALQSALAWFGYYDGAIDGAYGKGTRGSFAAWQTTKGFDPTGVLRSAERAQLLAEEAAEKSLYGFDLVTESESGIEAVLPMALIAFQSYEPPFVQFAPRSAGGPRLMLISEPGDQASLAGLYDLLQSMEIVPPAAALAEGQAADRALAEDSFTINATSDRLATYAWARASKGQVKGFILSWTPDNAAAMARIVQVTQTSFRAIGDKVLDPGLVPLDEAARQGLLTGLTPRKPDFTRSGFYVTPQGAILTLAQDLDSCSRITVDGDLTASLTASDPASGAALLTPDRPLSPPALAAFAATPAARGAEIVVAGYAYGDKLPAPVLTYGRLDEASGLAGEPGIARLSAPVLAGDQGGPVLTGAGAVIGLLTGPNPDPSKTLPAEVVFAADAASLTAFLTSQSLTPTLFSGPALTPDALSAAALGMTLRVDCWK